MGYLEMAMNILRQEGPLQLFNRSLSYTSRLVSSYGRNLYYSSRSILFGDDEVVINGIRLDLGADSISPKMVQRIRRGRYEQLETEYITSYLRSDLPTIDLGSGIGYTTCLIDDYTNSEVVGVEANENLIPVIKRNRSINRASFNIRNSAYDSQNDFVEFKIAEDFWSSSQYKRSGSNQQKTTISACSLENLISDYDLSSPIQLVVDIEGGEHDLITEELDILSEHCERMIIEFHSFIEHDTEYYESLLDDAGFNLVDSNKGVRVYVNSSISG